MRRVPVKVEGNMGVMELSKVTQQPLPPVEDYRCSICGHELEGGGLGGTRCHICPHTKRWWQRSGRYYSLEVYRRVGLGDLIPEVLGDD